MKERQILQVIQDQYGAVARSGLSNDSQAVRAVAQAFGYSEAELASLPPQANMGLSCGNPVAIAALRAGEVVLDLGCGGGMDVLLAAKRVGPAGKAIGIDMTAEMIERAKAAAVTTGATNAQFHRAEIEHLPLPDASVDCVISNCVINLVPDKRRAFAEILRVLKPGGRIVLSDIALKQPLPESIRQNIQAYVGCIAGAIEIADYQRMFEAAGFDAVVVQDTGADLNAYAQLGTAGCCSAVPCGSAEAAPAVHDGIAQVLSMLDANQYAASMRVHALKSVTNALKPSHQEFEMKTIQVYDKPMCCSTGVCGPEVDPALVQFASDLKWLQSQGHRVERFNLAQQPTAFAENPEVRQELATEGTSCLPLIVVDGQVVSRKVYPARAALERAVAGKPMSLLPVAGQGGCCGGTSCC